ncbi:Hypothetical_protein [Hexamita inflata]|uniref:Hypothetical_protein n=1 Tax=Hexamita inflata TaxID=28002 RepID=A0AA86R7Z7_9EUKA|nr:Hypothetical protein HINF_LOCUS58827 [Hexamita inflata]
MFEFLIVTHCKIEFVYIVPIIALAYAIYPDENIIIFLIQTSKIYVIDYKIKPTVPPNTLLWSLVLPENESGVNDDKFELYSSIYTILQLDLSQQPKIPPAIVFIEPILFILMLQTFKLLSVIIVLLLKPVMPPAYVVKEFDSIESVSIYTLVTVSSVINSQAIIPPKNELFSVDLDSIYEYIILTVLMVLFQLYQSPYQQAIIPAETAHYSDIVEVVQQYNEIFYIQVEHYLEIAIKPEEPLFYQLLIIIYVNISSELNTDNIENYEEHIMPADNPQLIEEIEEIFKYDQITVCQICILFMFNELLIIFIIIPLTLDTIECEEIFDSITTMCVAISDDNDEKAINPEDSPSLSH